MKKHIPNFITSLNLASGFLAIILAAEGKLLTASWLILAAMIFDFLDGLTARLLKAYSEIGKQLDSLADVVSFGIAPAIILYKLLETSLGISGPMFRGDHGLLSDLLLLLTLIMPVCAALRLAIFNTDVSQLKSFRGLPTPANALAVISIIISRYYSKGSFIDKITDSPTALALFTLIISILMVTRIPMLSLKTSTIKFRGNEGLYLLVASVIIALVLLGPAGAILIIPLYIVVSLVNPFLGQSRRLQ